MFQERDLASLRRWSSVLIWQLALFIVLSIASIPIGLIPQFPATSTLPPAVLGLIILAYSGLSFIVLVSLIVCVPAWTYRAWKNLHRAQLSGLNYSAGWAAASYYVPIANLFIPFLAIRELYNRSMGEDEYQAKTSVGSVTGWWAFFWTGSFLTLFILMTVFFNMNGTVYIVTPPAMMITIALLGNVCFISSCVFLILTVRAITRAQHSFTGVAEAFA